jgi:hypothetical protein
MELKVARLTASSVMGLLDRPKNAGEMSGELKSLSKSGETAKCSGLVAFRKPVCSLKRHFVRFQLVREVARAVKGDGL